LPFGEAIGGHDKSPFDYLYLNSDCKSC